MIKLNNFTTVKTNINWMIFRFKEEVETPGNVLGYRFSPPDDVFAEIEKNPDNECFCPSGPPCAPHGLFNVSLCQYGNYVQCDIKAKK